MKDIERARLNEHEEDIDRHRYEIHKKKMEHLKVIWRQQEQEYYTHYQHTRDASDMRFD